MNFTGLVSRIQYVQRPVIIHFVQLVNNRTTTPSGTGKSVLKTPDKIIPDVPNVTITPEVSPGRSELFTVESFMEGFDVKERSSGKIGNENDHENENENKKGFKNLRMKDENSSNINKTSDFVESSGEKSKEEKVRNALKGGYVATSMTQAVRRTDTLNSTFPDKTINFDIYETSNLKEKIKLEQNLKKEKDEVEERNKMLSKMKIFENDENDIEKSLNNSSDNNNKIDLKIASNNNTLGNKNVSNGGEDSKNDSVKNLESKFDEIFDAKEKNENYEDIDDEFLNHDYDDYNDNDKDSDKRLVGKKNNNNDDDEFDQIFSSSPNHDLSDKDKNNHNNIGIDKNKKKSSNVTIFDNDNDDYIENDEFPEICLGEDNSDLKIVNEESV